VTNALVLYQQVSFPFVKLVALRSLHGGDDEYVVRMKVESKTLQRVLESAGGGDDY
jgi:hypothetical protein